jgi:hypothetical protein
VTGLGRDGVGLSLVLGQTGVDGPDNIGTDGGLEDGGERGGSTGGLSVGTDDRNSGSGRLFIAKVAPSASCFKSRDSSIPAVSSSPPSLRATVEP